MSVLVTKPAPFFFDLTKVFLAVTPSGSINDKFNFKTATNDKYAIVFFYPMDFTFVCPSEIIAFNNRIQEFQSRNVEIIAVSIDNPHVHVKWRDTSVNDGGIGPVKFTMVSDIKGEIMCAYDVGTELGVALRGSFLIDKEGIVQHQVVNNLPLGRNVDEIIRMVDALQFAEQHGEVCPANWKKGADGMRPNKEGVASYLANHATEL